MIDNSTQTVRCTAPLGSETSPELPDTPKLKSEGGLDGQRASKLSKKARSGRKSRKGTKLHRFTTEQSKFLQAHFDANPIWNRATQKKLAAELKVPVNKIYKWGFDKRQQLIQRIQRSKGIQVVKCKTIGNSDLIDKFLQSASYKFWQPDVDFNLEVHHLIDSWDNKLKNTSVDNKCSSNLDDCDVSSSLREQEHPLEDQRITTDSFLHQENLQSSEDYTAGLLERMDDEFKSLISEDLKIDLSDVPSFENSGSEGGFFNLLC